MSKKAVVAGLITLILFAGVFRTPERVRKPGALAPDLPHQTAAAGVRPWKKDDFVITPLARYSLRARVVLTDRYWFGRAAKLSPVDLTLAWDRLSDTAILSKINLAHYHRYYTWSTSQEPPLDPEFINRSMANVHIVPADAGIARSLKKVIKGDLVFLEGYLIEASTLDGWSWRSSLTREDSGDGACELFWVERISVT